MEPMWEPPTRPYRIQVKDPEKKSKFKGMKTFTAYNVIPDVSLSLGYQLHYSYGLWRNNKCDRMLLGYCGIFLNFEIVMSRKARLGAGMWGC